MYAKMQEICKFDDHQNKIGMDREEKFQSILKAVETDLKLWLEEEVNIHDPIEYETKLLALSFRFGKNVLINSGGKLPKDRNSKKKF